MSSAPLPNNALLRELPAAHYQPLQDRPPPVDADFRVVDFDLVDGATGYPPEWNFPAQDNPDWAFVTERDEKLYFVRETKSTLDSEERRTKENQKIACGRRHFTSIGVDFSVVTSLAEVSF